MTPQERDVIGGIFDRLKSAQDQQRDPIAEKFIAERMAQQPYAAYAMAQSIYVQETALQNLSQQVEQLQAQVTQMQQAQAQAQAAPAPASGGFFGKLFDQGQNRPATPPAPPAFGRPSVPATGPWGGQPQQQAPAPGPWGGQPQQGMAPQAAAPAAGGGFMKSALTTAAGVAGGMVVGSMLMNAFSGSGANQQAKAGAEAGTAPESSPASLSSPEALPPTQQNAGYDQSTTQDNATYDNASYDESGSDFGGGGGDDWA